jgi:hypothetical protein
MRIINFHHIRETLVGESLLHFAGLHHGLEAIAVAELTAAFAKRRHSVHHRAHGGHTAQMIPYRRRDHSAWPHDTTHLADRLAGFGYEMQHKQRQRAVEQAIVERQVSSIRLANLDPWVSVEPGRFLHEQGRIVDCDDLTKPGRLGEREGQAAVAAADVENPFPIF